VSQQNRVHLSHSVIVKSPGLLNMLYAVSDLANDLAVPESDIRNWLTAGAPHQTDADHQYWINGREFYQWVGTQRKHRISRHKLADNEAYCFRCRTAVKLVSPEQYEMQGKLILNKGKCPNCGCTINRGGRNGQSR
jgi:hypothetical protein